MAENGIDAKISKALGLKLKDLLDLQ